MPNIHSIAQCVKAKCLGVAFVLLAALGWAQTALAQGPPFNCDVVFYQIRNKAGAPTESMLFKFGTVSPTVTPTAVFAVTQTINIGGVGYNPNDNYMYALQSGTGTTNPALYRIGSTGYQWLGTVVGLPGGASLINYNQSIGGFDAGGRYYFSGQGGGAQILPNAIFRLDSVPSVPSLSSITVSFQYNIRNPAGDVVTLPNFGDFDFNGAGGVNGLLLAATRQGAFGGINTMGRVTLINDSTSQFGTASASTLTLNFTPATPGTFNVGSAFWDAAANAGVGKFYVYDNNAGTFWDIQNPEVGIPTASSTTVPQPVPDYLTGVGNTDGSSCPISGTRRAELTVTKTDNKGTVSAGAITAYTIVVANDGPYPANYTTIQDPKAPGLTKLSVSCTASVGPPFAVCPALLSTTTFEAGVQVITFPPGTTLTFTVNTLVTDTVGINVTNSVSATVAADTTETNRLNNIATDVDLTVAPSARVNSAPSICPAGTVERQINLFPNGDLSASTPFSTSATLGAIDTWGGLPPATAVPRVTRQQFAKSYGTGPAIVQQNFPGDAGRSVPGSDFWLLVNGPVNSIAAPNTHDVWRQTLTGLVTGRTYTFMVYASNATRPTTLSTTFPDYSLAVATGGAAYASIVGSLVRYTPTATVNETGSDTWTLVQGTFTAGGITATLAVQGTNTVVYAGGQGKQTAFAQAQLRECAPSPDVAVDKRSGTSTFTSLGTNSYTITVANSTPGVTASNTLIVDPPVANIVKATITCVATAGATCPASLNLLDFEGAGLTIPRIGGQQTVTFVVFINVTGPPSGTVTNIVTISSASYLDTNPTNNQSQHTATIIGSAALSITKTNGLTELNAGQTMSYTVTVGNGGSPSATVIGAVLSDLPVSGLACTAITCTGVIGLTSCPTAASTTINALQGSGIALPSMAQSSSIIFTVTCGVIATGRP